MILGSGIPASEAECKTGSSIFYEKQSRTQTTECSVLDQSNHLSSHQVDSNTTLHLPAQSITSRTSLIPHPMPSTPVTTLIRSARKAKDWQDAQNIAHPDSCTHPTSIKVRERLLTPSKTKNWEEMDNKVIDTFGICVERAKPPNITSELRLFKLVIHAEFSDNYGTKTLSSTKRN